MTVALLLRPITADAFNARLRELGHDIPTTDPDAFAPLCKELAEPIPGDEVEIGLRVSSTLCSRTLDWDGYRNSSGQPVVTDKPTGESRHHKRKDRR